SSDVCSSDLNGVIGVSEHASHKEGRVIIGRVGSAGSVNMAKGLYAVSDNAIVLYQSRSISVSYVFYLAQSLDFSLDISKSAQPLITASRILEKRIPIISKSEQTAIARFLDRETERID